MSLDARVSFAYAGSRDVTVSSQLAREPARDSRD